MTALVAAPATLTTPFVSHIRLSNDNDSDGMTMINVFLKMWDGKTLCCVLEPHQQASLSTAVACLEQKILDSYPGYDRRNFFMELHGKPLSSSSASHISQYRSGLLSKSSNNACVFVHYRNRGGCFMISFTILMTIFMLIITSTCTCGASLLFVPLLLPFLFVLPLFCL